MDLFQYARMPGKRRVTATDRMELQKLAWNPHELIQLKLMSRAELMGLMMFCDITTFNEDPVIVCDDDEIRMAYLIWRGAQSMEVRQKIIPILERIKQGAFEVYDGVAWWLRDL